MRLLLAAAGHLEEMGAAVVRTLLDYCAPPELNSAPDLCAQLDAALLQGVTDVASTSSSAASSSNSMNASTGSTLEKLGLCDAGDDEDVCTDSDDESSDDERPVAAAAALPATAPGADPKTPAAVSVKVASSLVAGGSVGGLRDACPDNGNGSSGPNLADISRQLAEILAGRPVDCRGAPCGAMGNNPAADAVLELLQAIRAADAMRSTSASGPASNSGPSSSNSNGNKGAPQHQQGPSSVAAGAASSSASSSKQASQAVTAAAQQLLDKLHAAKAKLQSGASAAGAGAGLIAAAGPSIGGRHCTAAILAVASAAGDIGRATPPGSTVCQGSSHNGESQSPERLLLSCMCCADHAWMISLACAATAPRLPAMLANLLGSHSRSKTVPMQACMKPSM